MIYTDGTIAIKAGSPIVTGTGTQWKKNIHGVAPGQMVSIENGTNPVNMMIRAVNSDTELVLSFNAPVTLSSAKYSIATTVPDTISDAARTMSANQGYIVYFLQAMQQWMTDTGQVEIELPNGQKVTLEDLKGLASQDWINSVLFGVGDKAAKASGIMNPDNTMWWGAHNDYLYAKIADQTFFKIEKDGKTSISSPLNVVSSGDYTTFKMWRKNATSDDGGVLAQLAPWNGGAIDSSNALYVVEQTGASGTTTTNRNSWLFQREGVNRVVATRQWVKETSGVGITSTDTINKMTNFSDYTKGSGLYGYDQNSAGSLPSGLVQFGGCVRTRYSNNTLHHILVPNYGQDFLAVQRNAGGFIESAIVLTSNKYTVDANGFYKKSSPIIQIYANGNYETNDESEGAEVHQIETGQCHITGILGYHSDGAWGVNGGISVPKDNNGLELVYVADRVLEDGGIIIETCHRQHAHLPDKFQNWRLKEITDAGDRVFYQDGEPCDLPEYTRLDVRVEMPQGSVWNVKQRELAEQMEREQAEREVQEAAERAEEVEE